MTIKPANETHTPPEQNPEQEKALTYLNRRREVARKREQRFESALDRIGGYGNEPETPEDLEGLMHLSQDELADKYEEAGKRVTDISRTVTEVEEGNQYLAEIFAGLEEARERAQARNETTQ